MRRRSPRTLALFLALAPAVTLVPISSASAAPGEIVRGTIAHVATEGGSEHDHENPSEHRDEVLTYVEVGGDALLVEDPRVTSLAAESDVVLRVADADADVLRVLAVQAVQTAGAAPAAAAAAPHVVDVVLAVPAGATQDTTPFTLAQTTAALQQASDYWSTQTDGQISFSLGNVQNWYQSTATCSNGWDLWADAATKVGFTDAPGRHLLVVVPRSSHPNQCGYGLGTIGASAASGGRAYVADVESSVWAHELGHNLSLGHANLLSNSGSSDVAASGNGWSTGTEVSYGNIWDVMSFSGDRLGHGNLNIAGHDQLGTTPTGIQTVTSTGIYTVNALPNRGDGQVHGLKVVDPTTGVRYYVELRGDSTGDDLVASSGWNPSKGVLITRRQSSNAGAGASSVVLDGSPTGSSGDYDFNVASGQTLTAASQNLRFSVLAADGATAQVRVVVGGLPTSPTAATVAGTSDGQATVNWAAGDGNGTAMTGYVVTPQLNGAAQTAQAVTVAGNVTTATVTGLTNGEDYTFTIRSRNANGDSAGSAPTSSARVADVPGLVTGVQASVVGNQIRVQWNPADSRGENITKYLLTTTKDGGSPTTTDVVGTSSTLTPDAGSSYAFSIRAVNARGTGAAGSTSSPLLYDPSAVVPGQVSAVTFSPFVTGSPSARVAWTPPAAAGSGPVTDYRVTTVRDATSTGSTTVPASTQELSIPVSSGHTYQVTVEAKNSAGWGAAQTTGTTLDLTRTPDAPTSVAASLLGSLATVTWNAAADNGSAVFGYSVAVEHNGSVVGSATVSGLTASYPVGAIGTYRFLVTATNHNGNSTVVASNSVTQFPVFIPPVILPNPPIVIPPAPNPPVVVPPVVTPPVVAPPVATPVTPAPVKPVFDASSAQARVGGTNRYDTAAQVALSAWTSAKTVIIANGEQNGIDALSASYLAGVEDAPILLTNRDTAASETLAALTTLDPEHVIVVGGESSISAATYKAFTAGRTGQRIAGVDRYDTAALLLAAGLEAAAVKPTSAFLVRGDVYGSAVAADALAVSPVAFRAGMPVLLTGRDELPAATLAALENAGITSLRVAGNATAVSDAVTIQVLENSRVRSVERLAGPDRTGTAAAIARFALAADVGFSAAKVGIANGYRIDALAAGAAAGKAGYPLLLTESPDSLGAGTSGFLAENKGTLTAATVFGDTSAVSTKATDAAGKTVTS